MEHRIIFFLTENSTTLHAGTCLSCWLAQLAMQRLADGPISTVNVTDTIPGGDRLDPIASKVRTLSVARLLGEAVHRIHHDQSVSAMFRTGAGTKR